MRKILAFLMGLVTGAAVVGGVVLLFAPKSGKDMRASLRAWVDDLLEEGRLAAETRRRELEAQLAAFKQGGVIVEEPTA